MTDLKVMMIPHTDTIAAQGASGIQTLVRKYFKYLPDYGIELVHPHADSFDLLAVHAGTTNKFPIGTPHVSHIHGLYWTADFDAYGWEHKANRNVINSLRNAETVTVPSEWVAQNIRRDMRLNPIVVRHGIDWKEWQSDSSNDGYVLWNKNRDSDVCSAYPVSELAHRKPGVRFLSTFCEADASPNIKRTGLVTHDVMQEYIKRAGVYLATTKETFGIGTLEAMAAGVPILGFNHGGTATIVAHGVTGYLANPDDYDDLERGLEYCIKHRDVLGANAREASRKYDWPTVAEYLAEDVYRGTMRRSQSASVSVVIPCFNKADTLERAVISVMQQTLKADRVVIVDNNSTDNSYAMAKEIAERYAGHETEVRLISCRDQGVAYARNAGVESTDSRYVCCLDADDEIAPDFLKKCASVLDGNPEVGLSYTKLEAVDKKGNRTVSAWPDMYDYDRFLEGANQVPTCCVFRRILWDRLGGYRQRYAPNGAGAEDAEFWLRMGSIGYRGELATREPLFVYHLGGLVSGNPQYREMNWRGWHPWVEDAIHPFASVATPHNGMSHPVRQYDIPSISVIIPCSPNHLKYTVDVLDSLDAQTYRLWEAIVVVDGSEAPAYYKNAYPHVKWLSLPKASGPGAARNLGARNSDAPLLLFVDADDWLTPEALELMAQAYDASPGTIVYTNYFAHCHLAHGPELQKAQMRGRIKFRDDKTDKTILLQMASEFDCLRAHIQPEPDNMYIWNLITSLVPKRFHNKIGGFDETMESWEDWDYWLRMSHEGICFTWLEQPLVEYRFDTGSRRALANPVESGEDGRQLGANLIQYLQNKYEGKEKMACGGCKKHHAIPVQRPAVPMANTLNSGSMNMSAGDMVWVLLDDGNVGSHPISFGGTSYGYRASGEKFKMLRAHADLDLRVRIVEGDSLPPSVQPDPLPEPPPPPQYAEWENDPEPEMPTEHLLPQPDLVEAPKEAQVLSAVTEPEASLPLPAIEYDLTKIWGITEEREKILAEMGVRSPAGVASLTEGMISSRLGVTDTVAKRIISSASIQ